MALESSATLITALLNHTVNLAINHVVQFNDTAAAATLPSSFSTVAPPEAFSGGSSGTTSGGLFDTMQVNGSANEGTPQIPAYIRNTSMVFCIVIMCLGVIGNIMVSILWQLPRTPTTQHNNNNKVLVNKNPFSRYDCPSPPPPPQQVPIVIMKTKDMRNSTNIFLTNLSIADLLVLLVCTPTVLVEVNSKPETWVLGQEMCKFRLWIRFQWINQSDP